MSLRVLVVDDTVVFRRAVSDALGGIPDVEVVGTAADGKIALSRMATLQPDLVTLDIEMPGMTGIEVLQTMAASGLKAGVIVLSAVTVQGGVLTVRALELGAFDFLTKPEGRSAAESVEFLRSRLGPIVRAYQRSHEIRSLLPGQRTGVPAARPTASLPPRPERTVRGGGQPMVLIAVSTGGPAALATLLPALPGNLKAPVFIVQHMPPLFTQPLAASLAAKCSIRIREAQDGDVAAPGCAYLAPGGKQMKLARGGKGEVVLRITDDPPENNCKPAADYLFRSAALQFPGRSIAAILTGMGNDGTGGLRMLKRSGCVSIAQDEATCVVFGMPKEAIQTGLVDMVEPLQNIAPLIARRVAEAQS